MSSLPRLAHLANLPPHAFQTSPVVDGELSLHPDVFDETTGWRRQCSRSRTESGSDAIALLPALLSDDEKSWAGTINPGWTCRPIVGFS